MAKVRGASLKKSSRVRVVPGKVARFSHDFSKKWRQEMYGLRFQQLWLTASQLTPKTVQNCFVAAIQSPPLFAVKSSENS